MKLLKVAACLTVVMLISSKAFAIAGPHAFGSSATTIDAGAIPVRADTQVCIVCHVPHNATGTLAPLWNHSVGTGTVGTNGEYTSGTLNATVDATLGNESLACLACHDGTVAVNAYTGTEGTSRSITTNDSSFIDPAGFGGGFDFRDDHPVGFTYDTALSGADPGLEDPSTTSSGLPGGRDIDDDMLFGAGLDQMECASCHDVHGTNSGAVAKYLVMSNAGSALCTTCHIK